MNINKKSVLRWGLMAGYLGLIALMLACMGIAVGTSSVDAGSLQLNNGAIEVQNQNGETTPVAGLSTFEVVGALESTDPWTVAGKALTTNETTKIEDGLKTGDLVRVRGTILEDGTWLAYSIELAEAQTQSTIVLIGVVTSIDPWVVNGITLNVTSDTKIQGTINPGMLVRVEILLQPDGTWQVLSIAPLGDVTNTTGCATVIATVVSVNGDEVQFLGWPTTIKLDVNVKIEGGQSNTNTNGDDNEGGDDQGNDDNGNENQNINQNSNDNGQATGVTLAANQVVLVVICNSDQGEIVIVQIIILNTNTTDDTSTSPEGKVLICHKPDKNGGHTLSVASPAVPAHLAHGDKLGACP